MRSRSRRCTSLFERAELQAKRRPEVRPRTGCVFLIRDSDTDDPRAGRDGTPTDPNKHLPPRKWVE
jgi:hypothetical protein